MSICNLLAFEICILQTIFASAIFGCCLLVSSHLLGMLKWNLQSRTNILETDILEQKNVEANMFTSYFFENSSYFVSRRIFLGVFILIRWSLLQAVFNEYCKDHSPLRQVHQHAVLHMLHEWVLRGSDWDHMCTKVTPKTRSLSQTLPLSNKQTDVRHILYSENICWTNASSQPQYRYKTI